MDKLKLTGRALGRVFNFRNGCMCHTLHLRPGVAKQPKLELKTRPKQLLGSLPLVIALPGVMLRVRACFILARLQACFMFARVLTPSSPVLESESERKREGERE
jgi:hypothetical protein